MQVGSVESRQKKKRWCQSWAREHMALNGPSASNSEKKGERNRFVIHEKHGQLSSSGGSTIKRTGAHLILDRAYQRRGKRNQQQARPIKLYGWNACPLKRPSCIRQCDLARLGVLIKAHHSLQGNRARASGRQSRRETGTETSSARRLLSG